MSTLRGKKYGLILSSKKTNASNKLAKPSVFGDSSSDEEDDRGHVNISLRLENEKKSKQTHETVAKALVEDPNIFEYDTLYDDMVTQRKKLDPRLQKKDTKPKYIAALKRSAERRKIEQDIIYERKVQLEMEREGKEYGDQEAFLTSAYRKKLEERKRMEEELREEARREEANDITKQKDLSRFYRHLLHQQDGTAVTTADEEKAKSSLPLESGRRRSSESKEREEREERRVKAEGQETAAVDAKRTPEKEPSPQKTESLAIESQPSPPSQGLSEVQSGVSGTVEQQEMDSEERRRIASAKRTDSQAFMSAKERYMARKRAKLATASSPPP